MPTTGIRLRSKSGMLKSSSQATEYCPEWASRHHDRDCQVVGPCIYYQRHCGHGQPRVAKLRLWSNSWVKLCFDRSWVRYAERKDECCLLYSQSASKWLFLHWVSPSFLRWPPQGILRLPFQLSQFTVHRRRNTDRATTISSEWQYRRCWSTW